MCSTGLPCSNVVQQSVVCDRVNMVGEEERVVGDVTEVSDMIDDIEEPYEDDRLTFLFEVQNFRKQLGFLSGVFQEEQPEEDDSCDGDPDEVTVGVETLDNDDERIEDIIEEFETEDLEEIENHPD